MKTTIHRGRAHKTGTGSLTSTSPLALVPHPHGGQKRLLLHGEECAKHQRQFVHGRREHNSVGRCAVPPTWQTLEVGTVFRGQEEEGEKEKFDG